MSCRSIHHYLSLMGILLGVFLVCSGSAWADEQLPVKDMVTMIDLGAENCLPCRMMTPILAELQKTYQGKAAIVFIDVYRDNTAARKFNTMVTPTQIFFDRHGKEASRHLGFMNKEEISKELDSLLAQKG